MAIVKDNDKKIMIKSKGKKQQPKIIAKANAQSNSKNKGQKSWSKLLKKYKNFKLDYIIS